MPRELVIAAAALGLVVAALLGAGEASAAAAWSVPQGISASANDIGSADVAIDRRGRVLATWGVLRWETGASHGRYVSDGSRAATRAPGARAFATPRRVPSFAAGPLLYGVSRAVGIDTRAARADRCGARVTLRARFGTSSGSFAAPRTITVTSGRSRGDGSPALAASDSGFVLAAWTAVSRADCRRSSIRVALRRPGTPGFGRPVVLRGRGLPELPSVAVGAGGDMLAAWARRLGNGRTLIEARIRPAGRGWGPVVSLATSTVSARLVTAVSQNGRAYVAWASQNISESTGVSASIRVAVRPAGARAFRPAQTLEQVRAAGSFVPFLGPVLALAGTGAYMAWTGKDGAWRVRVAATDARGRFAAAQTLSPAGIDSALGDIAALRDGTAAVTWSGLDSEFQVKNVMAAVRRPSGQFGLPELVSDGALRRPSIAIDSVTRQPTVVWPQRLGPATRVAEITAFTRASTRTGD